MCKETVPEFGGGDWKGPPADSSEVVRCRLFEYDTIGADYCFHLSVSRPLWPGVRQALHHWAIADELDSGHCGHSSQQASHSHLSPVDGCCCHCVISPRVSYHITYHFLSDDTAIRVHRRCSFPFVHAVTGCLVNLLRA